MKENVMPFSLAQLIESLTRTNVHSHPHTTALARKLSPGISSYPFPLSGRPLLSVALTLPCFVSLITINCNYNFEPPTIKASKFEKLLYYIAFYIFIRTNW